MCIYHHLNVSCATHRGTAGDDGCCVCHTASGRGSGLGAGDVCDCGRVRVVSLHGGHDVVIGLSPGAELEGRYGAGLITVTCAGCQGHGRNRGLQAARERGS